MPPAPKPSLSSSVMYFALFHRLCSYCLGYLFDNHVLLRGWYYCPQLLFNSCIVKSWYSMFLTCLPWKFLDKRPLWPVPLAILCRVYSRKYGFHDGLRKAMECHKMLCPSNTLNINVLYSWVIHKWKRGRLYRAVSRQNYRSSGQMWMAKMVGWGWW